MQIRCVLEHNGSDTLLYAADCPGAFARGKTPDEALAKLPQDVCRFLLWRGGPLPDTVTPVVVQEKSSALAIADADSDVLFDTERAPLPADEYAALRDLCLRSAADFAALYAGIPDPDRSVLPPRRTFYGDCPRTARQMLDHTQSVNAYYFGEIGIDADNGGSFTACRARGFAALEQAASAAGLPSPENRVVTGSYNELWSLRKVLRRFLWHDRIHARAMWRMARRTFPEAELPDPFFFGAPIDAAGS